MSTLNPGSRRSLDGPVRRVAAQPSQIEEVVPMVPMVTQPIAPSGPVAETPVFEYRKPRHVRVKKWKWARRVALALLILVLMGGAWFGWKAFSAARNIIGKSHGGAPALNGDLDPTRLKGEGDGRINVLILGIGGAGHEGPNLSDTLIVMSIDPKTKDAAMLSVPRDLYVKIPATGKYGTQYSKINSANALGGPELAEKVVSNVIGVPIHYYVQVDFSGFKQAIDAVGGVDINVPQSIYDATYPCDNEKGGYCPFSIKAGQQHMTGTVALRYSRTRHTISDFGRAANQQLVISALKTKATQLSTLTNPVKLMGLIDSLGSHVKTDMQPNEIVKMASIAKDIDSSKVANKVLDTTGTDSLLIDGSGQIAGAGSIELPRAGNFDYSDIHDFVKNIFVDHYITDENAKIEVQNGSGVNGAAGQIVKSLKAAHYNVGDAVTADQIYSQTVIYDYTGGKKPYTINYLERRFGVKAKRMTAPSPTTDATGKTVATPEIRIILGSDYKPTVTPVSQ
jgi:LCP family protein required for cell wall assembly